MSGIARSSCVVAVEPHAIPVIRSALTAACGAIETVITVVVCIDLGILRLAAPDILIADIDALEIDPIEVLRQLRFVLPDCVLVVYTGIGETAWARTCHLAGANGLLSKKSKEGDLAYGLQLAMRIGSYTDPRLTQPAEKEF